MIETTAAERVDIARRLDRLSIPVPFCGCRIWMGNTDSHGYGLARFKGKAYKAHRLSYVASIGDIPDGLGVCHTCDTPLCIEPSHLFTATQFGNVQDMVRKGRAIKSKSGLPPGVQYTHRGQRHFATYRMVGRKRRYLGSFFTAEEAADAYRKSVAQPLSTPHKPVKFSRNGSERIDVNALAAIYGGQPGEPSTQ